LNCALAETVEISVAYDGARTVATRACKGCSHSRSNLQSLPTAPGATKQVMTALNFDRGSKALWTATCCRAAKGLAVAILPIVAGLAGWQSPGHAEPLPSSRLAAQGLTLPFPAFAACASDSQPLLPRRWRAVALMAPFENRQLDIGEFAYDADLPAMRATVHGLDSGSIDLLITDDTTYQLTGPREAPTGCAALGRVFRPPPRQWLSEGARCAGKAPILSTPLEWWTMPEKNSSATWYWYRTGTRLPWRVSRTTPSGDPAVIGGYAMANFTTFERLPHSELRALRDFCRAQTGRSAPHAVKRITNVRALMARHGNDSGAENSKVIARLIPELDRQACTRTRPVRWPRRFASSAAMITAGFGAGPFPTEIFYDWQGAKAQLARLHIPDNPSSKATLDVILNSRAGYHILRDESGAATCRQSYPAVIRPDWMKNDHCQCRGIIKRSARFDRNTAISIFSCPVRSGAFWAWYGADGRPIMFRSTAVRSSGLALADYYHWAPGADIADGALDLPRECKQGVSSSPARRAFRDFGPGCGGCHLRSGQDGPR